MAKGDKAAWEKFLREDLNMTWDQGLPSPKAVLVKPDGSKTVTVPANGKDFTLKEAQTLVGGDVQLVPVPGVYMLCDEEGKYKDFRYNTVATKAWFQYLIRGDHLVGDIVFCQTSAFK